MSPERRLLLALAISILVMIGWSAYFREAYPPVEPLPAPEQPEVAAPQVTREEPPPQPPPTIEPAPAAPVVEVKQGSAEQTLTVETGRARITFSTRGAVVRNWTLKEYADEQGDPLDLAHGDETGLGFPLEWAVDDPELETTLNQALFVVTADGGPAAANLSPPVELVFEWADGQHSALKRLRFHDGYLIELETQVLKAGTPVPHRVAWRGGFGDTSTADARFKSQLLLRTPAGLQRHPAAEADKPTGLIFKSDSPFPYTGPAAYVGVEDRYFAAVFFPIGLVEARASVGQWKPAGEEKARPVGSLAVGTSDGDGNHFQLFAGPKAVEALNLVPVPALPDGTVPDFTDELVNYGWFWWVAKPLFLSMRWLYENLWANYGWVIILLTVIINIVIFPLKYKSMKSSFKMQKLAPQMRAIQEKYKKYKFNDPRKQQMQQEIMALYREHGVNPMGSCLPLLLQLPFFYGFYRVLASSIELRQAPWFGWVHDLSQRDPYYILPVVMTLAMYISTKMTPMTAGDPSQQRMMQFMPLMFGFFFLTFPAGLVLYWLSSSVVGIGQQWWINNRMREHQEAEKRAAKERKKKKRRALPASK